MLFLAGTENVSPAVWKVASEEDWYLCLKVNVLLDIFSVMLFMLKK